MKAKDVNPSNFKVENVVISAFLNAFLAVVWDNHYMATISVNHVTAFLPHEPKAIFSKQRYNVFN